MATNIARLYDFVDGQVIYSDQMDAELNMLVAAHNATEARLDNETVTRTYVDTADALKADATAVYTKTNLQTSGGAAVHWGNLTNVPNFGDAHWKTPVANIAALPLAGNTLDDIRVVLDDGDGKQAVYLCIATTGTVTAQWTKIADVDWVSDEATRITQENARVTAEADRVAVELARQSAESDRAGAEATRVASENTRVSNESGRVAAEYQRVDAENQRAVYQPYDSSVLYKVGNKVAYSGATYVCIVAPGSAGVGPENATYWLLAAAKGDHGDGLVIADSFNTLSELQSAYPLGNDNTYKVVADGNLYIWSEIGSAWISIGELQGPQGEPGTNGISAYQAAVAGGYTGTEAEFTAALVNIGLHVLISQIVNDLTSGGTQVPLSAEQGKLLNTTLAAHTSNTSNPHSTTAAQVGLGNVTNESKATMFASPTFTGTVVLPSTTSIGNVTNTEIGYLDGVTSAIQTQLAARLALSGGTMTGVLTAQNNTAYTTKQVRNITLSTSAASGGANGDIWFTYTA